MEDYAETMLELCQNLENKMNEIVLDIKTCIDLLAKDGCNTKAEVKRILEHLVEEI